MKQIPSTSHAVDLFYRAFEDRNRGPRELIKSRLLAYLPFIKPIKPVDKGMDAIDLGCGRGEWLELLGEHGFKALGIDLNEGMLAGCHLQKLNVQQGNALDVLEATPSESVSIVSAFHMVEHLPFDAVRLLVREALRVLRPGGLLILETPNPENIEVASSLFYLDPSHIKPIPAELLRFTVEYTGFARNTVVRLQEPQGILTEPKVDLIQVFTSVSPDYAIVAQKKAEPGQLALFDAAFAAQYGINFHALAGRYQAEQDNRYDQFVNQTSAWMNYAESRLKQSDERFEYLDNRISQLEIRLSHIEGLLVRLHRLLGKGMLGGLKNRLKHLFQKLNAFSYRFPALRHRCIGLVKKLGLHALLSRLIQNQPQANVESKSGLQGQMLSTRANRIHAQIQRAQQGRREES